jgi:Flp pilus assembly protein TadG
MLNSIRRIVRGLKQSTSGNATMLVAIGMPILIGTSGLAVDSAQFYLWKRDLQFAVDSAALSAAWARTNVGTQSTYQARASQEYNANIQVPGPFDTGPTTTLGVYDSAANTFTVTNSSPNAVRVKASATKTLPFSNLLIGRSITVAVQAIATSVPPGNTVTTTTTLNTLSACMVALNPTAQGAFIIGGNASGSVGCGGAALSTDPAAAIRENGNPSATFGQLVAGGGIEYSLLNNVGGDPLKLKSNTVGMVDPVGSLVQPTGNGISRVYSCPTANPGSPAVTTYTATQKLRTVTSYVYKKGNNAGTATVITPAYTGTGYLANSDDNPGVTSSVSRTTSAYVASGPTQVGPTVGTAVSVAGNGNNTIWRVPTITTYTTISNVGSTNTPAVAANDGIARPLPGTYTDISISCQTIFQPGIYVINGTIDFSTNKTVSGTDVLFVMASANRINNINSNTNLSFSGITSATLMSSYGYSLADGNKLSGMIFYDKYSTDQLKFNGNSTTNFNGVIYMPRRTLWFNGTSAVSGACMMLIADKLQLDGTTNLSSFCQPANSGSLVVRPEIVTTNTTAGTSAYVKLVG